MATSVSLTLRACPAGMSSSALPTAATNLSKPRASLPIRGLPRGGRRAQIFSQSKVASARLSPSSSLGFLSSSITETHLPRASTYASNAGRRSEGGGALGAVCGLPTSPENLRWVVVVASAIVLYVKNTAVQKDLLVPLLALEVPRQALGFLKGDYGLWVGFIALAAKLFYFIPAEIELPVYALLLIITAPFQLARYRGTTASAAVSLGIAGYVAYQHYASTTTLKGAFQGDKIIPSIASVILVIVPILFLINGAV